MYKSRGTRLVFRRFGTFSSKVLVDTLVPTLSITWLSTLILNYKPQSCRRSGPNVFAVKVAPTTRRIPSIRAQRMAQWMSAAAGERKVIFQSSDDRITTLTKTAEAATFERAISVIRRQSICESPAAWSNPESAAMHQVSVLPWSFFHRGLQVRQPSPAPTTSCAVSRQ